MATRIQLKKGDKLWIEICIYYFKYFKLKDFIWFTSFIPQTKNNIQLRIRYFNSTPSVYFYIYIMAETNPYWGMYVFFIFTFILVLYRVLNLWNTIRTRQTLVLILKDCVFAWPLTFLAWYRHLNKNLYAWQWNCINADHIAKVWGLTVYSHVENTCMVHVQSLQTKITCIMLLTGDI